MHVQQISMGQNVHADSLACLASIIPIEYRRTVAAEYLSRPSTEQVEEMMLDLELGPS